MPREFTHQLFVREIYAHSAWGALLGFVEDKSIDMFEAIDFMALMFRYDFADQVQEAKKEVAHLSRSISRLEQICKAGGKDRQTEQQMRSSVNSLYNEFRIFDGWVTSLYETDLTMYDWIDPMQSRAKPTEMAKAVVTLRQKRLTEALYFKNPSLFKRA